MYIQSKRQEIIQMVTNELARSDSSLFRRTFVHFCLSGVKHFSRAFFKDKFMELFFELASDRVPIVKIEFAKSLMQIKPYFDYDRNNFYRIMDTLDSMRKDPDKEVADVVDSVKFHLETLKPPTPEEIKSFAGLDLENQELEQKLAQREEEEEKKKKQDEEEEQKFDFQALLQETNKQRLRVTHNLHS